MTGVGLRSAVYVYGLVRDDGAPLPDAAGLGGSPIRLVRSDATGLAAVVSDAAELGERVGKADLLAHSDVLQTLVQDRDVLPVRFGSLYPSDEEMCGELLAANAGPIRRLLERMAGKVEMQVKLSFEEAAVTADIVASEPKVRKARDRARSAPDDRGAQLELGRVFAAALDSRRESVAQQSLRRLARVSDDTRSQPGRGDFGVARIACLVPRKKLDRFEGEVGRRAGDGAGGLEVELLGPLPPYSFVSGSLAEVG